MQPLLERDFRASPRYELVLFDRLGSEEREALAALRQEPGFYGVLRPLDPGSGLGLKSVDRDTALLFLTLREPGPLPTYVQELLGAAASRVVAKLVADGVLEAREGSGFLSGAAALGLFAGGAGVAGVADESRPGGGGRLGELSRAALRYGQALGLDDPLKLSWRLYGYNRRPLTSAWQRLLPTAEAVETHLGLEPGGRHRHTLDRSWRAGRRGEHWLHWHTRPVGRESAPDPAGTVYKLYVSPAPEALAEGFGDILEALTQARARQLKVGSNAAGLLRPDKIVAYFPGFDSLSEAAGRLEGRLAGLEPHGVPFSAEISGDGLLSWGADPPRAQRSPLWGEWESWRLWLTNRLAAALVAARGAGAAEPWRFALERVRLEGVDTDSWIPGAQLLRAG